MEEEPRVLEFRGEELARVSHAYGTNGIITEIEMPLAPAYDWVEMFVAFDDFMAAARFAEDLANQDGILIKLATVFEAPIAHDYFQRVKPHVEPGDEPGRPDGRAAFDGRVPDLPGPAARGAADLSLGRQRLGQGARARCSNTAGTTPRCAR